MGAIPRFLDSRQWTRMGISSTDPPKSHASSGRAQGRRRCSTLRLGSSGYTARLRQRHRAPHGFVGDWSRGVACRRSDGEPASLRLRQARRPLPDRRDPTSESVVDMRHPQGEKRVLQAVRRQGKKAPCQVFHDLSGRDQNLARCQTYSTGLETTGIDDRREHSTTRLWLQEDRNRFGQARTAGGRCTLSPPHPL
jgi:hypothetical protein